MNNTIKLTKDNLFTINNDKVIALFISEPGAMGEPGAFHLVTNDLTHYYNNLDEVDFTKEEFYRVLPVMESFKCFFGKTKVKRGWTSYYAGYGNYLIVRSEYKRKINKYLKINFNNDYKKGELYKKWFMMLKDIKS